MLLWSFCVILLLKNGKCASGGDDSDRDSTTQEDLVSGLETLEISPSEQNTAVIRDENPQEFTSSLRGSSQYHHPHLNRARSSDAAASSMPLAFTRSPAPEQHWAPNAAASSTPLAVSQPSWDQTYEQGGQPSAAVYYPPPNSPQLTRGETMHEARRRARRQARAIELSLQEANAGQPAQADYGGCASGEDRPQLNLQRAYTPPTSPHLTQDQTADEQEDIARAIELSLQEANAGQLAQADYGGCASGEGHPQLNLERYAAAAAYTPSASSHLRHDQTADEQEDQARAMELSLVQQSNMGQPSQTNNALSVSSGGCPPLTSQQYLKVKLMMEEAIPTQFYKYYIIFTARDLVRKQKYKIIEAEKLRNTKRHPEKVNRQMLVSYNILLRLYTLCNNVYSGDDMRSFRRLLHASRVVINERASSYSNFQLHSPLNSIRTSVEQLAYVVMEHFGKINIQLHIGDCMRLKEQKLLPLLQYCRKFLTENLSNDLRIKITEDIEIEAASLFNGYERNNNDGKVFDPDYDYFASGVFQIEAKKLHAVGDYLLSSWSEQQNSNIQEARDDNLRSNLLTLAESINVVLTRIEGNFEEAKKFWDSALPFSTKAEALGYIAPHHSVAVYLLAYGMWSIGDVKLKLTEQKNRIEHVLLTTLERQL